MSLRKEGDLVRAALAFLQAYGILAWRNNTGGAMVAGKGRPHFLRFGTPGSGDIFAIRKGHVGRRPRGQFISIECKVGKNVPTTDQQNWARRVTDAGGLALTIYSVQDLEDGLMKQDGE